MTLRRPMQDWRRVFLPTVPFLPKAAVYSTGTASMITKACASGKSSVIVRWIDGPVTGRQQLRQPRGRAAGQVMVGLPPGRLTTPMSRQNTPCAMPVPSALAQASLAAKRLA